GSGRTARCVLPCSDLFSSYRTFVERDHPIVTQSHLAPLPPYPTSRPRRSRRDAWSRKLVAENRLSAGDLIWRVFVHDEKDRTPVDTMPGAFRHSLASLVDAAGEA